MLKEFRPTILFLIKFIAGYLIASLIYGFWVTSFYPQPDPVTRAMTIQSAHVLNWIGWDTAVGNNGVKPTTFIQHGGRTIISVYEGCNGINVAIVFLCFLFSFGPINRTLVLFASMGLLFIYVSNILRIVFLFIVSIKLPTYFYFSHKYLFTASIYLVVFLLWVWWVKAFARNKKE